MRELEFLSNQQQQKLKSMDYKYNYSFLRQFMRENDLKRTDLLNALHITNYASMGEWIEGKKMITLSNMIKLCNAYQLPITSFFLDGDAVPQEYVRPPKDSDQLESLDGDEERADSKTYEYRSSKPMSKGQQRAMDAAVERREQILKERDRIMDDIANKRNVVLEQESPQPSDDDKNHLITIYRECYQELRQMERAHRDERQQLTSIINRQNEEIARLHKLVERKGFKYSDIDMAAEEMRWKSSDFPAEKYRFSRGKVPLFYLESGAFLNVLITNQLENSTFLLKNIYKIPSLGWMILPSEDRYYPIVNARLGKWCPSTSISPIRIIIVFVYHAFQFHF